MYGLIVKLATAPGRRDAVIAFLEDSARGMPGCQSYVIAKDAAADDVIWVTEVWDSEASHAASLALPAVQRTIPQVRPLVAAFERIAVTVPVGDLARQRS